MSELELTADDDRDAASPPGCPRCGYDQSGLRATWEESDRCPLRGVCSECGFEFEWGRLLNAERYKLPWLYEHAPGRRPMVRRAWRTWQRVILPWRFWRESDGVRLDTPHNWWRLSAWLPVIFLSAWVVTSTLQGCSIVAHIATDPAWAPWRAAMQWQDWAVNFVSPFVAILGRVSTFNTPAGRSLSFSFAPFVPYPAKVWLLCTLVMPDLLMLLPITRAVVKVRGVHVVRAAVYSLGLMVLWPLLIFGEVVLSLFPPVSGWFAMIGSNPYAWEGQALGALWMVLGVSWFAAWWWVVLVRAFALPRGRLVWGMFMVACVLASLLVAAVDDDLAIMLFAR